MKEVDPVAADRPVLMITAGGLEHGGGIGRMVGYTLGAWTEATLPPIRVIDTRGPKYSRWVWPFYLLKCLFEIVRFAPRNPVLHVHLAANSSTWRKIAVVWLGRLLRLDYVIHLHDPTYAEFYLGLPGWARALVREMYLRAGRVIALGSPAKAMISSVIGVPAERIEVVPNAVPGPSCPGPLHTVPGVAHAEVDGPCILFLGQLQQRKGVHDLIDALARPELAAQRWRAILAGGGPDQNRYQEQARARGILPRICFPGWLPRRETEGLLETASILVLPSYAEEMAMSVLEGMAYGLCVVSTPVGALAEVLDDGVSAVLVTPGDVDGLAAALSKCLADPELRRRVGRGARDAYLRRYNVADYPQRIVAVHRRARRGLIPAEAPADCLERSPDCDRINSRAGWPPAVGAGQCGGRTATRSAGTGVLSSAERL
jgi:glycosyltransferase involved in cell wall biosynthesis